MANQNHNMSGSVRFFALATFGLGITLATGFVHGRLTQRWWPVPDLQRAAQALEALPRQIGDWQLASEGSMPASVVETLRCVGYVNRNYVNRQSGRTIAIAIIVGPPGPTAVHTPEICYSSRDYAIHEGRKKMSLSDKEGKSHSFWSVGFRSNNPSLDRLHVYYAWRSADVWTASESPRFEFAGRPLLYKLQTSTSVPAQAIDTTQDSCQEFLSVLLRSGWNTSE
jgi:hypothetical protein